MVENWDMDNDDPCNATIDLGGRGIHLCFLRRGHTGSHRHSELMAALAEHGALAPAHPPKWDGNLSGGQWVPRKVAEELRHERDELREWRDRAVASCARRGCSLMEQTIREQRDLNDKLAFELGGLKWELEFARGLLRRLWSSVSSQEDETIAQEVVKYLAGVPGLAE